MKLDFYVTTDYRLKALSYVSSAEAPETSIQYTAESKDIRVELLESSTANILGTECLDVSNLNAITPIEGNDCVWDNSASSSSNTTSSTDSVYLTVNNIIRAAGIKSLNEENTKYQNVIESAFSSTSFDQLSCECRIAGLNETETQASCESSNANYTSHSDVVSYPYRLSGMDLVMNVEWRNTPYCAEDATVLQDRDCFFSTRGYVCLFVVLVLVLVVESCDASAAHCFSTHTHTHTHTHAHLQFNFIYRFDSGHYS